MLRPIREMARLYAGPHLEFDVQLVLKRREVPRCRLGGDKAGGSRLGWNTWVRHGEYANDVDDAIFSSKI
jgi:type VI secretion system protein ImpH